MKFEIEGKYVYDWWDKIQPTRQIIGIEQSGQMCDRGRGSHYCSALE